MRFSRFNFFTVVSCGDSRQLIFASCGLSVRCDTSAQCKGSLGYSSMKYLRKNNTDE